MCTVISLKYWIRVLLVWHGKVNKVKYSQTSIKRTLRCNPLARVNDLFQFWAVSVHTMPKCFSCRHEKQFGIVSAIVCKLSSF